MDVRDRRWIRPLHWLAALTMIGYGPACRLLNGIEKVEKIPGLEEARLREGMERSAERPGGHGPTSALEATPRLLDFGPARVGSRNQQTVTVTNPSHFPVTVLRVSTEGCGFAAFSGAGNRPVIAAQGQLALTVTFQPPARGACSGHLLLEIDSAGGRFTRVKLEGRGI